MAGEALVVTQFLAAGLMFLLAAWLLWLNFASRVSRAFALFLFLRGAIVVVNTFKRLTGDPLLYWERVGEYFFLALVPTLAYFLVVYARPRGAGASPWIRGAILAGGVLVEALYLYDHCLDFCTRPDGQIVLGPLAVLSFGLPLASGIVGLVLALEATRTTIGPRRNAAFLVSTAFVLNSVLDGALSLAFRLQSSLGEMLSPYKPSVWVPLALSTYVLGLIPSAIALGVYTRAAARDPSTRRKTRALGAFTVLAVLTAAFVAWDPRLPERLSLLGTFLLGLWRLALPALVTYALLKHRLFDLDVKLKWTIRQSTIAAAFVGLFFVVSESAAAFLGDSIGSTYLGIAAAGFLVFAMAPLQRAAERIANVALPGARPVNELTRASRMDLYRDQAILAWADGGMDRSERRLLDQLRERLGLTLEETHRLEQEAMAGAPAAGAAATGTTGPDGP